jgi:hypothetical protein
MVMSAELVRAKHLVRRTQAATRHASSDNSTQGRESVLSALAAPVVRRHYRLYERVSAGFWEVHNVG